MDILSCLQVLFAFFLFILVTSSIWKKNPKADKHSNLPPGPWKLPVLGNLLQLVGSLPHRQLWGLAKKYGPVMHLQLGEVSTVVISSPEAAKEVMKTYDLNFAYRPFMLSHVILSYDCSIAFSPYGTYWRQMRKICTLELLSSKRVQSFRPIREEEVANVISFVASQAGMPIDFTDMIASLTFSITARTVLGARTRSKDQEAFKSLMHEIIDISSGFNLADVFPSSNVLHVISGLKTRLYDLHRRVDKFLETIISEDRNLGAITRTADDEVEADDLVRVLLGLQDNGYLESPLTTNNIKAVILDMLLGGTETSSTALLWAMAEMMKNPEVLHKAQAEVRRVFKSKGNVDEADLDQLNYLKLVVKETMRMHPPLALLLPRESNQSCEIKGFTIPVKSKVIINAWAIGRDPVYWNEPDRFYPERSLNNSIDYKGTNFEFMPFGAGRRACPGMSFGIITVEYPLAQLLYHFDWKLPQGQKPEDLGMTEVFGATVARKGSLYLIPSPYRS